MQGEKNRFVHDLRNQLNTISMNAELGKLTLERTEDIQKAISIFEIILTECRRCGITINEHKDASFVEDEEGDFL
jgi:hypothetical protein